jgi:acetate kinase
VSSVLVVNAGSASLKLSVLDEADNLAAALEVDRWDGSPDHREVAGFLARQAERFPGGKRLVVGHRVVHGGTRFTGPAVIDESVLAAVTELASLAPIHQPRCLAGIAAAARALPGVPQVACFDTAFHADLPDAAARYALPAAWTRRFALRRYGFHGLSHAYAARRAADLLGRDFASLRIVNCHLGGGASACAIAGGRSVDTTMGFTPLEGLVMATRSGSVDPGLLMWLLQRGGLSVDEVAAGLEHSAGLAGLADLPSRSGDIREVRAAADRGDAAATRALDVYVHRLRREVAAMAAAMDGLDALVFTGGIGEHDTRTRAAAADGLSFLGIRLDAERNRRSTADAVIGDPAAAVQTLVVTAREDLEIARQARTAMTAD